MKTRLPRSSFHHAAVSWSGRRTGKVRPPGATTTRATGPGCVVPTTVTAEVGLGEITGGFLLDIELRISLPGLERAEAEAIVRKIL